MFSPAFITQLSIVLGTLDYLIGKKLDLSVFDHRYHNDQTRAPAYDPRILLKVILMAYSRVTTSCRDIERLCRECIIFIALFCDEANRKYLYSANIDGYMLDKNFRKRDERFQDADEHYPKERKRKTDKCHPEDFIIDPTKPMCRTARHALFVAGAFVMKIRKRPKPYSGSRPIFPSI